MARTLKIAEARGVTLDALEEFVRTAREAGVRGDEVAVAEVDNHGLLTELEYEIY
ncbi:hypothetical protein [Streptomyces buecherae]|uniref:Uncharacterized protein n=1 Tax=Streptomyces buecherae TaxID=2763006 RepID=A0A7H8NL70_9ACTN|nr:hypothetical protein [Streptomyces buecherae]QKW55046.1 hypothetical protein HUT08_36565 [Streptomyces buecherae]